MIERNLRYWFEQFERTILQELSSEYENLNFYLNKDNELSVWIKDVGTGVEIPKRYRNINMFNSEFYTDLNDRVAIVRHQPDKYFFCTECSQVKPKDELEANVFAGYYCKDCATKPEITSLIKESKKRGFYD